MLGLSNGVKTDQKTKLNLILLCIFGSLGQTRILLLSSCACLRWAGERIRLPALTAVRQAQAEVRGRKNVFMKKLTPHEGLF
jgi:hypothetical protein